MKKTRLFTTAVAALGAASSFAAGNQVENVKMEMKSESFKKLSQDMVMVLDLLEYDWNFVESYLNDPKCALEDLNLEPKERKALETRSLNALLELGVSDKQAVVALSGTHRGSTYFQE